MSELSVLPMPGATSKPGMTSEAGVRHQRQGRCPRRRWLRCAGGPGAVASMLPGSDTPGSQGASRPLMPTRGTRRGRPQARPRGRTALQEPYGLTRASRAEAGGWGRGVGGGGGGGPAGDAQQRPTEGKKARNESRHPRKSRAASPSSPRHGRGCWPHQPRNDTCTKKPKHTHPASVVATPPHRPPGQRPISASLARSCSTDLVWI